MAEQRLRRLGVAVLAVASLAASGVTASAQSYNFAAVQQDLENSRFLHGGIEIYHRGRMVYRSPFGNWNNANINRPYDVASVTKTYTVAIAMAVDGDTTVDFDINGRVGSYITEAGGWNSDFSTGAANPIRIRHLMNMTSGIRFMTPTLLPFANVQTAAQCQGSEVVTLTRCVELLIRQPRDRPEGATSGPPAAPGTQFDYSGANHTVLALALLRVVNASRLQRGLAPYGTFTEVARDYLFDPCGLNGNLRRDLSRDPTVLNPDPGLPAFADRFGTRYRHEGGEAAGGGIEVSLHYGALFGEILRTGSCSRTVGQTVVTSEILTAAQRGLMQSNQISGLEDFDREPGGGDGGARPDVTWPSGLPRSYGYGLWRSDYPNPPPYATYFGIGAFGAHVFYSPDLELSGFLMLNDETLVTGAIPDSVTLMTRILPKIQAAVTQ